MSSIPFRNRLNEGILALFKAYKEPLDREMAAIWIKGLLPLGEAACQAVEQATYADEAFMPRVGQIRARAERKAGLLADGEAMWAETRGAMWEWVKAIGRYECAPNDGESRPDLPFLPPAAAYAVQCVGPDRFDCPRDSERLTWLRKEFLAAVDSYNAKPCEERLMLTEQNDHRLLERTSPAPLELEE